MGLISRLFRTKTKSDYDQDIAFLQARLAHAQAALAQAKSQKKSFKEKHNNSVNFDSAIFNYQSEIGRLKASISNLKAAKAKGCKFHVGNILSSDIFYGFDPDGWKKWARLGVLGVEMESYALYCNAARLNKRALCLLTVTDNFLKRDEKATAEQRAFGLKNMIEVAIATAERFAK